MDVFTAVQKRRSCRKYLQKPVEFEKIGLILESACFAPSAGHIQNWKFIIVNEPEKIQKISHYSFQQYWVAKAPVIIAVCSLCEKQETFYGKRGSQLYSIQSVAAAIENLLLTATALELGTCWVGGFEDGRVKDILQVPSNVNLHALITVGYPDEVPEKKEIVQLNTCVYFDSYGNPLKNVNVYLKDYSLEIEKALNKSVPSAGKLLDRLRKLKEKLPKK